MQISTASPITATTFSHLGISQADYDFETVQMFKNMKDEIMDFVNYIENILINRKKIAKNISKREKE